MIRVMGKLESLRPSLPDLPKDSFTCGAKFFLGKESRRRASRSIMLMPWLKDGSRECRSYAQCALQVHCRFSMGADHQTLLR